MFCKIFKSRKKFDTYLFIPREREYDELPESFRTIFGKPELVMELDIYRERKLARANSAEVLAAIERQGYYLLMPPSVSELK